LLKSIAYVAEQQETEKVEEMGFRRKYFFLFCVYMVRKLYWSIP